MEGRGRSGRSRSKTETIYPAPHRPACANSPGLAPLLPDFSRWQAQRPSHQPSYGPPCGRFLIPRMPSSELSPAILSSNAFQSHPRIRPNGPNSRSVGVPPTSIQACGRDAHTPWPPANGYQEGGTGVARMWSLLVTPLGSPVKAQSSIVPVGSRSQSYRSVPTPNLRPCFQP